MLPFQGPPGSFSYTDIDEPDFRGSFTSDGRRYEGTQVTESESHPSWKAVRKGQVFQGDIGGNFMSRKQYVQTPSSAVWRNCEATYKDPRTGRYLHLSFKGGVYPAGVGAHPFLPFDYSSNAELDAYGATAIARCRPSNQVASAAAALTELYHEGLPHLLGSAFWKDRTLKAKTAGGEYLNLEFGFKPLADDIAKFAYGVVYFDRIRAQYERDVGKVVRRRYSFPPVETRSQHIVADFSVRPAMDPDSQFGNVGDVFNDGARTVCDTVTRVNRWFSGAFTYYVPHHEAFGALSQAQQILGLEITPDMLWNVTPWSWAVDWFSNAGDVISNYQAFIIDGLVMRYGYIMEHTVTTNTFYHDGKTGKVFGESVFPTPLVFVTETKVRRRATPFGFGIDLSSLTDRQTAIAAALGINRGK